MQTNFLKLGLGQDISELLQRAGFTEPTPIQKQAIPLLLAGKDVIAQAQTGTGKTLAFVLPILAAIDRKKHWIQALIVTPTRELALQITDEVKKFVQNNDINVLTVFGGQDVELQVRKLQEEIHIVVGTPGRLLDHLKRGTIRFSGVSMLVLDEADQMLKMGFWEDVEQLVINTSSKRQMMLFSATVPQPVRALAALYMKSPVNLHVRTERITLDEIRQIAVLTRNDEVKLNTLAKMLDDYQPYLAIIFCISKQRVTELNAALAARGYKTDELHGELSQAKRQQVIKRFRQAKLQILIATDIASRGLDIEGVTHVFNYDIPHDVESYIHRIGRTGRAGETGLAVTFFAMQDRVYLQMIEKGIQAEIEKLDSSGKPIKSTVTRSVDKPDRVAKPSVAARLLRGGTSGMDAKPLRGPKPSLASRTAGGSESRTTGKPARRETAQIRNTAPGKPGQWRAASSAAKPVWGAEPGIAGKQTRTVTPKAVGKPVRGAAPKPTGKTTRGVAPGSTGKPVRGVAHGSAGKPVRGAAPGNAGKLVRSVAYGITGKPGQGSLTGGFSGRGKSPKKRPGKTRL